MKRLLITCLLIMVGNAMGQQFPISVSGMYGPNSPSNQYQIIYSRMQSANINWGDAHVDNMSLAAVENLLTNTPGGISLILGNALPDYGWAERFYFEGNGRYFNTWRGTQTSDGLSDQPPNDPYYDKEELEATAPNAYMVEGATYDPTDPWVNGASYQAYFRLRIQKSADPPPPTTPVASIEVWDTYNVPNTLITSKVLTYSEFASSNVYYSFELDFTPPSHASTSAPASVSSTTSSSQPQFVLSESRFAATESEYPDGIDVRVYWYGDVPTWLDDIRVESTDGKTDFSTAALFGHQYDTQITSEAQTLDAYAATERYYLKDEPYTSQYLAFEYLNSLLDQVPGDHSNGKGLGYVQKDEGLHLHPHDWVGDPWKRFLVEGQPHELAAEVDKFMVGDLQPGASGYTSKAQSELQNEMDKFDSAEADRYLAPSGTWRAHINSSEWTGTYREPHLDEIYAQVYSALAHGAKGINYFDFLSDTAEGNIGLVDPTINLNPINGSNPWAVYPSRLLKNILIEERSSSGEIL